jgi:hypothetical protein
MIWMLNLSDLGLDLDLFPLGPHMDKLLLHLFITKAFINAPHLHLRDYICHHIPQMAFNTPSLVHATMALSSLYRTTLLRGVSAPFAPETAVLDFREHRLSLSPFSSTA